MLCQGFSATLQNVLVLTDSLYILSDLPCGGCYVCKKKHEQWSSFQEVDDVVPLMARRAKPKDQTCPALVSFRSWITASILMFIVMRIIAWWSYSKAFIGSRVVSVRWTGHMLGGESHYSKINRVGASKMKGCDMPGDVQMSDSNELSEKNEQKNGGLSITQTHYLCG